MSGDAPSLVVGVGASAGGLQAFKELLSALPSDSGTAFLLVQHLDPNHESLLSELLVPHTAMSVRDAEQDEPLRPNTVYVIRPGSALAVRDGRIELSEPTLHRGIRLPLDHLFRSLAREYGARSVGVILSGAGSDGSSGLRDIKGAGGLTIAQEPDSSGQPGMPRSAIDTGLVDLVLEIAEMPKALERFATLPPGARIDPSVEESESETPGDAEGSAAPPDEVSDGGGGSTARASGLEAADLTRLKALLAAQIDFDLGVYKSGTVERRVLRRMLLSGFERSGDYLDHLRDRPLEQQTLVRDLLISVTSFFRDTEAHRALREGVVEPLISTLDPGDEIRVWVAGCATGEEAYSIGMTLLDAAEEHGKRIELQIFATDVDQEALAFARAGLYPPSTSEQISRRRLERYFQPLDGHGYRVRSSLRDTISFAAHDLTRDPPFSRMHIVSCRNVLIYLTPEAQRHVLGNLHFALRPDAHLVLSTSESPGAQPDLFTTVSKPARIYRKLGSSRVLPLQREKSSRRHERARVNDTVGPEEGSERVTRPQVPDPARRAVLEAWVPPTIVVSGDGAVLFMHGNLSPYLSFPQGDDPRFTLDAMLRRELATRTRGALYQCRRHGRPISALSSPDDGRERRVRITAKSAAALGDGAVMLSFEELADERHAAAENEQDERNVTDSDAREAVPTEGSSRLRTEARQTWPEAASVSLLVSESQDDEAVLEQLESELRATREDLRNTVEELETSNEELRSSNEESMSMNEELQSANEELEATTEELRSLNEELTTVNGQLREKIEQLEQAHDDLGNFFASARVAMIFLDDHLRIKRFTPAAAELLGIDRGDVGRFTGDIARELLQKDLEKEARAVLEHLETRSRELHSHDGRWFARRVLPYRTESRRIEGVVVTLLEVTELKHTTERLTARERQQGVIARLGLDALGESDLQEFMDRAVREMRRTLELDYCHILELQPGEQRLLLRAGSGWDDDIVGERVLEAGSGTFAGHTLGVPEPVIAEQLATEKRFSAPEFLNDHGDGGRNDGKNDGKNDGQDDHELASALACTVRDGERAYGVIGGYTREPRAFSEEDADFVQAVANIVGSTITHYQARLRARLEHAVSRTLIEHDDADEILMAVLARLARELDTGVGEIWWRSAAGAEGLDCRLFHTLSGERRRDIEERLCGRDAAHTDDIVARVVAHGRAVGSTDLGDPALFAGDERARTLGFRIAFGVPIRSGDALLGVMTLYSRRRLFANDTFLDSLESIGRALGERLVRVCHERRARQLAAITEASHDALFSHDAEGRVIDWLPGAERLFGFAAEEMIGESVERLIPEERRDEMRRLTGRILAGETIEPFESVRLTRDEQRVEVSVRNSPIRDGEGRIVGISSTDRDITRLKETERKLRAADHQKDEFLAMLGHELRNPLSSIRSAADLLAMSDTEDPEIRRTQKIIERQSTHMASLLDGLLDVSRIINGKITLERHVVDFIEVCREVVEDSAVRVDERDLTLELHLPDETLAVEADRIRLVQIVDNLLSNAIRYTPEGGAVRLSLVREPPHITLRVADDGIGIDAELLPHVFDVFRQSHRNLDRAEGGLGLGLSLARSLVALHGGDIEAHSAGENQGAEFVVRLPASTQPLSPRTAVGSAERSALDLLVIEDNVDTADVIGRVLRRLGHRVTTTGRGPEGVTMAVRDRPDVVLCDLGLPDGVSGYDVAREIRERVATGSIRLIALSGYGRPEDRARSLEAGFDTHLTKPVGIETLRRALVESVV